MSNRPKWYSAESLVLSFFCTGLVPKFPGTVSSFFVLPFLYLLGLLQIPVLLLIPFFIILFALSTLLIDYVQKKYDLSDPSWIVIDEVIGMLLSWFIFPTHSFYFLFLHFLFFRIFDIFKPGPIGLIDKRLKNALGVILDDALSGVFSGLLTLFCYFLTKNFF